MFDALLIKIDLLKLFENELKKAKENSLFWERSIKLLTARIRCADTVHTQNKKNRNVRIRKNTKKLKKFLLQRIYFLT
jgi:hypothetical protein